MGSPRGAGSRSALSERTDREKMYTLQPQEPSMTHIDGGYGGTVCRDLGVATATSNEQLIRSADDRCLGASAAVSGDGDAGEKRGRCRRDASCEGSQLLLAAGSEGACIDMHPSAAITRSSIQIAKRESAPPHDRVFTHQSW